MALALRLLGPADEYPDLSLSICMCGLKLRLQAVLQSLLADTVLRSELLGVVTCQIPSFRHR